MEVNRRFTSVELKTGWTFKQGDRASAHGYAEAGDLPTEIYRDLLKNEKIADPFIDLNELSVRWVGDETWTYRATFAAPSDFDKPGVRTVLRFDGLDTFASVYLNAGLILVSDNMFVGHRVDVTGKLQDKENVLEIVFESAQKKGAKWVEEHSEHRSIVHQTDTSRAPVRKAQYHWGWDWGPILLTCGPWKPIYIESSTTRLSELWLQYDLAVDLKSATVKLSAQYEGNPRAVSFSIVDPITGKNVLQSVVKVESARESDKAEVTLHVDSLELWWPRGYGGQKLYTVQAEAFLATESSPVHTIRQKVGFRKTELIKEPDRHGTSFYLRINHVDIFCGGSCWIPADSFLTRPTPQDYRAWVELAANGNQNMVRVWGGGIYEADALYDAADEFGVLMWQDFGFACANYPGHPEYVKSVETEATQNVRRLRNHPSLVLWAGDNEDYQLVEKYGLEYDVENTDVQSWLKTDFPARYFFEHLLPEIIRKESPNVPYHPSSPFGNGKSSVLQVDATIGDIHQWNMWGALDPYQRLPEMGGRFVSEFGMEAYPHISTLEGCITQESDRQPGSMVMEFRNKAVMHERRLLAYVAENFRVRYDLEGFAHLSQVMQADAMSWAYQSWRRQWGSAGGRQCGGALVWQLNDCWPTISWAVVDYHRVPKPSYYAIKRAMDPVTVSVQRKYKRWTMRPADALWQRDTGHIQMDQLWANIEYAVWVSNSTLSTESGEVVLRFISINTGQECFQTKKMTVTIAANGTTELLQDSIVAADAQSAKDRLGRNEAFVIHASLFVQEKCIASDAAWPDPIKYLTFDDRGVKVSYSEDNSHAYVSAAKPVKAFVFAERKGVQLSDNGFDILPGEVKAVHVVGCGANALKWRYVEM